MLRLFLFVFAFAFYIASEGAELQKQEDTCLGMESMRISARHIEAGGIGYNKGYTSLEAFIGADPNLFRVMPFLDVRGHVFNDGKLAANAGFGIRSVLGCRVYGINAYYDYRHTSRKDYSQVGIGLESLGKLWDGRVNGYFPFGKKMSSPYDVAFAGFQGNALLVDQRFQYAMKGFDAEVGFHFAKRAGFDFYAAVGPYYFIGDIGKRAIGGKARIAAYYKKYVALELSDSCDNVFKNNVQGQLTLSFPFGPKSKPKTSRKLCQDTCLLEERMIQPVARQEIVVVSAETILEATDEFVIFVDNQSHSLGTYESPYPSLVEALSASRSGDIIYVYPGDGTTNGLNAFDGSFRLLDHQQLLSAGISQTISTNLGEITIPKQASLLPSLTANAGANVVTLASGNTISGFQITADAGGTTNGNYCIGSTSGNASNLTVMNNTLIANDGAMGIFPNNPSGHITITGNTINSLDLQGTFGVYLAQAEGSSTCNIQNNLIFDFQNTDIVSPLLPITGTGIAILAKENAHVEATVKGNQVNTCRGHGIDLHAVDGSPFLSGAIANNQLEGNGDGMGIFLYSGNSATEAFTVFNNIVENYAFSIIAEAEETSSLTGVIQGNTLSVGLFASGVILETNFLSRGGSAKGDFTVLSNNISDFQAQGIATAAYGTSSLTAEIRNNNISAVERAGIYAKGFNFSNTNLNIDSNDIGNNSVSMEITPEDNARMTALVQKNILHDNEGAGIIGLPDLHGNAKYQILTNTFYGNNFLDLYSGSAVTIITDGSSSACLRMQDNQSTLEANTPDYFLQNISTGKLRVEPLTGNTGVIEEDGTTSVSSGYCNP